MNPWTSPAPTRPTQEIKEFQGTSRLDPYTISDGQSASQRNICSDAFPALSVRPGFSLVGGGSLAVAIQGLANWKNTELHTVAGGNWYKVSSGLWSISLASGLSNSASFSFANFKGGFSDINMIAANGVDAPRVYNGSTVTTLSGAPATGNYVISYDNRVFMVVGNLLYASGLNLATDWTSTGTDSSPYQLSIDTLDGESVCGLAPGIGHVTIFKPNSIHELFGSSPSDVRKEPVTFEVGALNNQSIVSLNGTMYFIHRTGIYKYGGSYSPTRTFSQPVQAFIDEMYKPAANRCCAGTDGRKLYFSVPSPTSTLPDTTLVYDPIYDIWTVYKDFLALQYAQSMSNFYVGLYDGRVVQWGGTTDNGTAINWEWVSKPFSGSTYSQKIRWNRQWITCDVPPGSSLYAYVSNQPTGDSDWVQIGAVTSPSGIQSARMILAPGQAFSNFLRIKFSGTGPCKIYEWDRDQIDFPVV